MEVTAGKFGFVCLSLDLHGEARSQPEITTASQQTFIAHELQKEK
jgi:hypothetical protein